jgi:hypothetical protein
MPITPSSVVTIKVRKLRACCTFPFSRNHLSYWILLGMDWSR